MDAVRRLVALVAVDLRQRTRQPRFWWLLALLVAATWLCLPAAGDNGGMRVSVGDARAWYSSAWVGMVLALCASTLLGLFGFYAVRGGIAHDIDSRGIDLLMATPMTRAGYLVARFLGMLAVFGLFLAAMAVTGTVGQVVRGEVAAVQPIEMLKPLLLVTLPALTVAAALAVWFDLVPWLRSTMGNVLYFFLWLLLVVAGTLAMPDDDETAARAPPWVVTADVSGVSVMRTDILPVLAAQRPDLASENYRIGGGGVDDPTARFDWPSWSPSPTWWWSRLLLCTMAIMIVLAATPLLGWASARPRERHDAASQPGFRLRALDRLLGPLEMTSFGRLVAAELRLALRPRGGLWWAAAVGAGIAQAVAPAAGRQVAWLVALGLSLPFVAHAFVRDRNAGTSDLIAASLASPTGLVAARLAAALGLCLALSAPSLVRAPLPVAAGAASVAALGFALARLTGNARAGELSFVVCAYLAVNGLALFQPVDAAASTVLGHALAAMVGAGVALMPQLGRRLG